MRFPTMWYVRPAKPQISLRIHAVWSEPSLVAWLLYDCKATGWTSFGVSKLKRRMHRHIWVYTCQNATLLEITCHGSYDHYFHHWELTWSINPKFLVEPNENLYKWSSIYLSHNMTWDFVRPAKPQTSLTRGFISRLNILLLLRYWLEIIWSF